MTRSFSARPLLLALLPLLFVLSACDSGGTNDEPEIKNDFSFTITPTSSSTAVPKRSQKDLNGYSFFVDTKDIESTDDQAFVIYFNGDDSFSQQNAPQGLFGFLGRESSQPSEGDYSLTDGSSSEPAPSEFIGFLFEDLMSQDTPYYVIRSGTLTITSSNDNRVSGKITATGTEITIEGSGENIQVNKESINITGDFTAEDLDTYVPFDQYTRDPSGS